MLVRHTRLAVAREGRTLSEQDEPFVRTLFAKHDETLREAWSGVAVPVRKGPRIVDHGRMLSAGEDPILFAFEAIQHVLVGWTDEPVRIRHPILLYRACFAILGFVCDQHPFVKPPPAAVRAQKLERLAVALREVESAYAEVWSQDMLDLPGGLRPEPKETIAGEWVGAPGWDEHWAPETEALVCKLKGHAKRGRGRPAQDAAWEAAELAAQAFAAVHGRMPTDREQHYVRLVELIFQLAQIEGDSREHGRRAIERLNQGGKEEL